MFVSGSCFESDGCGGLGLAVAAGTLDLLRGKITATAVNNRHTLGDQRLCKGL